MRKYFPLVLICVYSLNAHGQHSADGMIQAEKNFADTSRLIGTQKAFIAFIDPSGIVFDKGKPVRGLELYSKSERRPGILTWEPGYAEIATTNDFGYTTGPWKYYANTLKENPQSTGYFVTVWHLTPAGWKFLIDFGITCADKNKNTPLQKKSAANLKSGAGNQQLCTDAEQQFIQAYTAQGIVAYNSFLSSDSRINYAGFLPATDAQQRKALLDSLPRNIRYTVIGSGMSPAKDLGYVYGSAVINDKQDGYLRIWRLEKEGWKIAVEVLHFK